jgi:uncharacterized protein involved in exopolysaccharide biosynthesis
MKGGVIVIKLLETIFRRFLLLFIMLLVPAIIGLGVAYVLPPSYQASATLWAFKRYEVIGATGAESDLQSTPAETQVTALTELLQTAEFDVPVAESANLKSVLKLTQQELTDRQELVDAYVVEIAKNVKVTPKGANLYQITYTNGDPHIAAQVVSAVIKQFQVQGPAFSVYEGKQLLQVYNDRLSKAQSDYRTAVANESKCKSSPDTANAGDQCASFHQLAQQAATTVQDLQSNIATLTQNIEANQRIVDEGTASNAFFRTVDPPVIPDPASRSKLLLTTGGIGVALGLLACVLYILVLVRRDRAFYSALDVQKATSYPVLMQIPQLPSTAKEKVTAGFTK